MFFVQIIFSLITLIDDKKSRYTFFRNKRYVFDEMLQVNESYFLFFHYQLLWRFSILFTIVQWLSKIVPSLFSLIECTKQKLVMMSLNSENHCKCTVYQSLLKTGIAFATSNPSLSLYMIENAAECEYIAYSFDFF